MSDTQPANGLFGPGIFGTGIDLTALDEDTAVRLGLFFGEQIVNAEARGTRAALKQAGPVLGAVQAFVEEMDGLTGGNRETPWMSEHTRRLMAAWDTYRAEIEKPT